MKNNKIDNNLQKLLKIKSISSEKELSKDLLLARDFLIDLLKRSGFKTKTFGKNKSIIYSKHISNKKNKTILIYGHYDVFSANNDKWETNPFKPAIINNKIYARGIADDKGQLYIVLEAVRQLLKENKLKNINLVFLIEGEEEISSPTLKKELKNIKFDKINYLFVSDSLMIAPNHPTIVSSLRGNISFQLTVTTNHQDVHSGIYGGAIINAAQEALALHTKTFSKSFLEKIGTSKIKVSNSLREQAKKSDSLNFKKDIKSKNLKGFVTDNPSLKTGLFPALEITEMYTDSKSEDVPNIIPHTCTIKYNYRYPYFLDGNNTWEEIKKNLNKHQNRKSSKVNLKLNSISDPVKIDTGSKLVKNAVSCAKSVYKNTPIIKAEGGSISIINLMQKYMTKNILLFGFADMDANIHAPNENMNLENFDKGIKFMKLLLLKL